jgi:hypothetical protein
VEREKKERKKERKKENMFTISKHEKFFHYAILNQKSTSRQYIMSATYEE